MNFLLDTDTCMAYLRKNRRVVNRFAQHGGGLATSTVVVGELWVLGLQRGPSSAFFRELQALLRLVLPLPYDFDCAKQFGELRKAALTRGQPSSVQDLMIAATALVHDLTLVSHNTKHFVHVGGLRLQDWVA